MKIKEFYIKESTRNKGNFLLVAITEEGKEYVVSGDVYFPTYLQPIEECWYFKED